MAEPAPIHLRLARPGDAGALAALEAQSFATDALGPAALRRLIRSPRHQVMVACARARARAGLVGATVLERRPQRSAIYVYSLVVAAAARRGGLGRRLLAQAEAFGRSAGCRRLELEMRCEDVAALDFYRGAGLRPRWSKLGWYADGAAAFFATKPILRRAFR